MSQDEPTNEPANEGEIEGENEFAEAPGAWLMFALADLGIGPFAEPPATDPKPEM